MDAQRTRATVNMLGFTADDESQRMRAFFERDNAYELRKLAAHLEREESPAH